MRNRLYNNTNGIKVRHIVMLFMAIFVLMLFFATINSSYAEDSGEETVIQNEEGGEPGNQEKPGEAADETVSNDNSAEAKEDAKPIPNTRPAEPQRAKTKNGGAEPRVIGVFRGGSESSYSSHDKPGSVYFVQAPFDRTPILSYQVGVDYENLEPGKEYTVESKLFLGIGSLYMVLTDNHGKLTVGEDGSGSWRSAAVRRDITFWRNGWTGDGYVEIKLTPANDGDPIEAEADGESMTVKYRGLSEMEITSKSNKYAADLKYAILDDLGDSPEFDGSIKMVGLEPNTEYLLEAYCADVSGVAGKVMWIPQKASENVTQKKTTDANGSVTFDPVYTAYTGVLQPNTVCMNMFTVKQSDPDGPDKRTYQLTAGNTYGMFYYMFYDKAEQLLYLIEDKEAITIPTSVDVTINNLVKDQNVVLPGAEFKIVKGSDVNGEIVDSWVQGKEPYKTKLPVGEYTLVQTKAPSGYKIAEPIRFTLTNDDANRREYSFLSDQYRGRTADGDYVYHMSIYRFDEESKPETHEVVYCINHGRDYTGSMDPTSMQLMYYTEYDIEDPILASIIDNPRLDVSELRPKLKQLVYGGYPNDKLSLKSKHSLSSDEFVVVTQAAIHYYTDTIPYDRGVDEYGRQAFPNDRMYRAFMELINTDIQLPDSTTVKVYIPDNDRLQAVLSTVIRDEVSVVELVVENPKVKGEYSDETEKAEKSEETEKTDKASKAETGDDSGLEHLQILLLLSMTGFAALIYRRSRER